MQCKYCGSPASDATIYCPACGEKLDGGVVPASRPAPQHVAPEQYYASQKENGYDWLTTLLLAVLLGGWGIHRFYTGHMGLGILMLLTGGVCGIMWLVDIILIVTDSYRDAQGRALIKK